MYIRISSLSFLGFLLFLTSCSSSKAGASLNPFLGKWITSDSTNIEFKENGKATFDGADITYSYGHDTLTLNQGNSKLHYKFKIDDNKLEISGGDLKTPMNCTRTEGGSILAKKAMVKNTEAGILGEKEKTDNPGKSASQGSPKTIYDTWVSAQETIQLRADGNCIYAGVAYKYTYDGSQIVVKTDKGDYTFGCVLNGDKMTLTTNQGSFVYSRKGSAGANTASSSRGQGQELVGKWCYMSNSTNISFNDCFSINANGTYSYNSDNSMSGNTGSVAENSNNSGTWTFDGSTIHVRTQGGATQQYAIQKTYNKNGDPCIVIGGKTYFSAYQHARW